MNNADKRCVVFVANRGFALQNSRQSLIQSLLDSGYRVVLITADDEYSRLLKAIGCELEAVSFNRGGLNLFADVRSFIAMCKIYTRIQPLLIHHFHAKPVILGGIAARLALGAKGTVVSSITGLGHAFINGGFVRELASLGYRIALRWASCVIFQNKDDMALFESSGWLGSTKARLIVSSGVNCQKFSSKTDDTEKNDTIRVLMVGRLLWQKGVGEFIEAAKVLKSEFPDVSFEVAGEEDAIHPDAVPMDYLNQAVADGSISYLGFVKEIEKELAKIELFVLPSYREGVPRVVLEAAACGVPSIGADVPGTREVIDHRNTGLLVPVRDVESLIAAIRTLLLDKGLRSTMGKNAREFVEKRFDSSVVKEKHLSLYRELGVDC